MLDADALSGVNSDIVEVCPLKVVFFLFFLQRCTGNFYKLHFLLVPRRRAYFQLYLNFIILFFLLLCYLLSYQCGSNNLVCF